MKWLTLISIVICLSPLKLWAETADMDEEIIKNLDFFSQMEVVENMDLLKEISRPKKAPNVEDNNEKE